MFNLSGILNNPIGLILIAIVASFGLCAIAESIFRRGLIAQPLDVQDRIVDRSERLRVLWYILTVLGYVALVGGILKTFGLIKVRTDVPWGLYVVAIGVGIICLERILRTWDRCALCFSEAWGKGPLGRIVVSTLLTTVVEFALAGVIGYTICTRALPAVQPWQTKVSDSPTQTQEQLEEGSVQVMDPSGNPIGIFVFEENALKIIGKDKDYLDLLVPWGAVKAVSAVEGKTAYNPKDLRELKARGLPSIEEMRMELEKRKQVPVPPSPQEPQTKDGATQEKPESAAPPPAKGSDILEE